MQRIVQISLVVLALVVGIVLVRPGAVEVTSTLDELSNSNSAASPAGVMLTLIESQIADQEDVKDVRCWSSVNKIQTFLSGLPVELEANGQRVERYVELIEDVWVQCNKSNSNGEIDAATLTKVLKEKFPQNVGLSDGKVTFDFGGLFESMKALEDSIQDYSDTIESWRLLQSWALRKESQKTAETVDSRVPFSTEALQQFRDFLVAFDIGLLKEAKAVAMERKLGSIDPETIDMAFDRMLAGESATLLKDD